MDKKLINIGLIAIGGYVIWKIITKPTPNGDYNNFNVREAVKNKFKAYYGRHWRKQYSDWKQSGGQGRIPEVEI